MVKQIDDVTVLLEDQSSKDGLNHVKALLNFLYHAQLRYRQYVLSIQPSEDTVYQATCDEELLQEYKKKIVEASKAKVTVEWFAQVKYLLEELFFELTDQGQLEFHYQEQYLLSSKTMQEKLGVSRATLMRMVQNGMETVDTTKHHKYPAHNIVYWSSSLWASKIQTLNERYALRNRTEDNLVQELRDEISSFEKRYGGSFQEVFADVLNEELDVYDLDEPDDFKDWRDALTELETLRST